MPHLVPVVSNILDILVLPVPFRFSDFVQSKGNSTVCNKEQVMKYVHSVGVLTHSLPLASFPQKS